MGHSWIFKTETGKLGLVIKSEDIIKYYIRNGLNSISGQWEWSDWVDRVSRGYAQGDTKQLNIESISYYFAFQRCAEKAIELYEVKYPGHYYPRIARENIDFNYLSNEFQQDIRAYRNIQNALDELFNYIEPSVINFSSFGHKIRELLILACTEVEYLLLKVLTDNGYPDKKVYRTQDYVKCKEILKLDSFEVQLNQYPNLGVFKPFVSWNSSSPTKSIVWYDAYNSVKHNRGDNIHKANLENLLNAVSAIHILLESQYGNKIFKKWESYTEDRSMFYTVKAPVWELKEITVPILEQVYKVKTSWIGPRKYFEDFPL
jgi:hypothetical protein